MGRECPLDGSRGWSKIGSEMTELRPFLQRFALGAALTLWAALHVTPSFAIVGGEEASSSSSARRYTVIVQSQKGELCSGAVIARNLVLTAAHCVVPNTKYRVISFDQNFVPTAIGVAAAARNPSFKLRGRPDQQTGLDIAVLELSEPFGGDIKPLAISSDLGVLSLARKYGAPAVDDACGAALELGIPTYRFVRRYLERRPPVQLSLRRIDPLIRELTHYRNVINNLTQEEKG